MNQMIKDRFNKKRSGDVNTFLENGKIGCPSRQGKPSAVISGVTVTMVESERKPPPGTTTTIGISTGCECWPWQKHCAFPKLQHDPHEFEVSPKACACWGRFIAQSPEAAAPEANNPPPSNKTREINASLIIVSRLL